MTFYIFNTRTIISCTVRNLCKRPVFVRLRRLPRGVCSIFPRWGQDQILILKTLNVFPRLKFSSSVALNTIRHLSKVFFLICALGIGYWIPAAHAEAETFVVRSKYLNPVTHQWDQEIKWRVHRLSSTYMEIFRKDREQPDMALTYADDGRLSSIADYLSGMKDTSFSPKERIILSRGFPVPYDFLDPLDNNSRDVVLKKKIGDTSFSDHVSREVQLISSEQAVSWNMMDEKWPQPFGEKLRLIIIKRGDSLLVRQLWPQKATWWIFEETDVRKSWRLP